MTSKFVPFLVAGTMLMAIEAAPAYADLHDQTVNVLIRNGENAGLVKRGNDGRDRPADQYYPGAEQIQITQLATGEILMFGMGTYELNGALPNNRMQLFCASVAMDPTAGPTLQSMQYITNNNGNRYRNANYPRAMSIFNGEAAYIEYNYAPDNRARRYGMVVGAGCQVMEGQTQVQAKNNDDCAGGQGGEDSVIFKQTATETRIYSSDLCNGNGRDDKWTRDTRITRNGNQYNIQKISDFNDERNEERTRGIFIATADPNLFVTCWTAGNTQPSNRGVRCAGYNTNTDLDVEDRLLWRQYLARREGEVYQTQIRLSPVLDSAGNPTNIAISEHEQLVKRRRREKGQATRMITTLQFSPAGMDVLTIPAPGYARAQDVTHGITCSTLWGREGETKSVQFHVSGSINGNPISQASAQIMAFDPATSQVTEGRTFSLGTNQDVGWLSNIYGNKPEHPGP